MTPFQLANIAEKTGFTEVAVLLRSGTKEAGELYSAVLLTLDIVPALFIATTITERNERVYQVTTSVGPITDARPDIQLAVNSYMAQLTRTDFNNTNDANVPVWDGDKSAYTVLSAFDAEQAALTPASLPPTVEHSTSSPETVVWGKEATYSGTKRIDGQTVDGETRFRMEKGKRSNLWDLAVSLGWSGGKTPTEKWADLLRGDKSRLIFLVSQITSMHDKPANKAEWPAWVESLVTAESYSTQRGGIGFSKDDMKAGINLIKSELKGTLIRGGHTPAVTIKPDARTRTEITIPAGVTNGHFNVPAVFGHHSKEELDLGRVLGTSFIEVDVQKAQVPTRWHPMGNFAPTILTVASHDGGEPVEIGVNGRYLAGMFAIVGAPIRIFATATGKRNGHPNHLAPLIIAGPKGATVLMPMQID